MVSDLCTTLRTCFLWETYIQRKQSDLNKYINLTCTKDQILCLVSNIASRFCHWQSFKILSEIHVFWHNMLFHLVFFALMGTLLPVYANPVGDCAECVSLWLRPSISSSGTTFPALWELHWNHVNFEQVKDTFWFLFIPFPYAQPKELYSYKMLTFRVEIAVRFKFLRFQQNFV
jgi:hypothetical protein